MSIDKLPAHTNTDPEATQPLDSGMVETELAQSDSPETSTLSQPDTYSPLMDEPGQEGSGAHPGTDEEDEKSLSTRQRLVAAGAAGGAALALTVGGIFLLDRDERESSAAQGIEEVEPDVAGDPEPEVEPPAVDEPEAAADSPFAELEAIDDIAEFNEATDRAERLAYATFIAERADIELGNVDVGAAYESFEFDEDYTILDAHIDNISKHMQEIADAYDTVEARKVLSALFDHDPADPGVNNRYSNYDSLLADGTFPQDNDSENPEVETVQGAPPDENGVERVVVYAGGSYYTFRVEQYETAGGEQRVAFLFSG